jgi:hypothetical protein
MNNLSRLNFYRFCLYAELFFCLLYMYIIRPIVITARMGPSIAAISAPMLSLSGFAVAEGVEAADVLVGAGGPVEVGDAIAVEYAAEEGRLDGDATP